MKYKSDVYLQKNLGKEDGVLYTINSLKKPFKIKITKYERRNENELPIEQGN